MQNNIECKFYADVGTTIGSTQILDNYQKKSKLTFLALVGFLNCVIMQNQKYV